ncbi:MAG: ABC transporter permease subunit [candidate division KSB1 bacterium]|nr:ABC transporter permease subunit [candidate division KSB1 bacterium]
MSQLRQKISFLQIGLLAVLVASILVPMLHLLVQSFRTDGGFGLQHYLAFFDAGRGVSMQALWGSVWVSLLSTLFAALIGAPLAFLFERFELPFKNLLGAIAILPVVLPPLVGVVAFMFLLSESGILPRLLQAVLHLDRPPFHLSGIQAVIAVHAYSFYVYFFLFTRAALKRLDGATIEAARSLGASSLMVFRRVIFPQIRPAFSAAAVLVFMISMASFSAPFIFAGETRILTVEIYNSKLQGNLSMAITQSVMLAAISLLFLGLALRGERRFLGAAQKRLAATAEGDSLARGARRGRRACRPGRADARPAASHSVFAVVCEKWHLDQSATAGYLHTGKLLESASRSGGGGAGCQ